MTTKSPIWKPPSGVCCGGGIAKLAVEGFLLNPSMRLAVEGALPSCAMDGVLCSSDSGEGINFEEAHREAGPSRPPP